MAINFLAIIANESRGAVMKKWEHKVFDYSESTIHDPLIRVYATSEGLVSEEVRRTGVCVCVSCLFFTHPENYASVRFAALSVFYEKNSSFAFF